MLVYGSSATQDGVSHGPGGGEAGRTEPPPPSSRSHRRKAEREGRGAQHLEDEQGAGEVGNQRENGEDDPHMTSQRNVRLPTDYLTSLAIQSRLKREFDLQREPTASNTDELVLVVLN